MTGRVFALFVGIDAYPAPVPALRGCVNDVTVMEQLLRAQLGDALSSTVLVDGEATRAGLTAAFETGLAAAGPNDSVLVYYSGHGSQQAVPDGQWSSEADRLDETLVLFDSRGPDGNDLADAELGALVAEVADRGPHVLVVLDCCHSGSGTRDIVDSGTRERTAPPDERPRSSASYAPVRAAEQVLAGRPEHRGDHVLIAACRSNETAKELVIDGRQRGVLSAALETALRDGRTPTYRELHRFVSAQARYRVRAQNPQLETTTSDDLDRPFLGGAVAEVASSAVLTHDATTGWSMDFGAIHGIPAPTGSETTHVTVYAGTPRQSDVLAEATVTQVDPEQSRLAVDPPDALDVGRTYRAVVSAWPLPALRVALDGSGDLTALRTAAAGEPGSERAALVQVVEQDEQFRVTATAGAYRISRIGHPTALVADVDAVAPDGPERVALTLEHLARWTQVAELRNPTSTLTGVVRADVAIDPSPQSASQDLLARYRREPDGTETPPRLTLTLTNQDPVRTLWFAVVDLPATYGVFSDILGEPGDDGRAAGVTSLPPGGVHVLTVDGELPDALWSQGVHEMDDLLKVIVSTQEFDPRSLDLPDLRVVGPAVREHERNLGDPASSLDRLLRRTGTRRFRTRPTTGEARTDWATIDLLVTIERPPDGASLPGTADQPVALAPGVTVLPHPALRGTAWLEAGEEATREIDRPRLPSILLDDPDDAGPFGLTATRGDVAVVDTLTIADPQHVDTVTPDAPLQLHLDVVLAADEHLLPVAWDGEFYLPLGWAATDAAGTGTDVVLDRLPAPLSDSRSLGGSIRILFRKLVGRRLGLAYPYPLLQLAQVDESGALRYDPDPARVAAAVASATSVLLYAHGIIGDTRGMALSSARTQLDPPPALIGERYDVVLAFDYENLDTSIADNAGLLAERLTAAGLGPDDGKRLDLVAHSMGGLVARHYIELGRGADVVDRLVTLGTPQRGSPWPTAQRWASSLAAAALNGLTVVPWPVSVLAGLVAVVEKVDSALDDMEPGSPLLTSLAAAPDPGVPYTVLVGTRSFSPPITGEGGPLRNLLARLSPSALAANALAAFFVNEVNDIAVSVSSASGLPGGRSPAVAVAEVASDHMSYFLNAEALGLLAGALPLPPPPGAPGG